MKVTPGLINKQIEKIINIQDQGEKINTLYLNKYKTAKLMNADSEEGFKIKSMMMNYKDSPYI